MLERLIETLMKIGSGCSSAVERDAVPGIVGAFSPVMRETLASLRKFAPVELSVLITGETGSGKEIAARALHGLSPRCNRPFAAINCGALPVNLVQSELFGHERGAFTGANTRRVGHFEAAAGGTVFLDEIGDLPFDAQTSLLRLLQEGTLVRVGSSTAGQARCTHSGRHPCGYRTGCGARVAFARICTIDSTCCGCTCRRCASAKAMSKCWRSTFSIHSTFAQSRSRSCLRQRCSRRAAQVCMAGQRPRVAQSGAAGCRRGRGHLDQRHPIWICSMCCRVLPRPSSLDLTRVSAEREAVLSCLQESHFNITECARRFSVSRVTVYRLCKKHHLVLENLRHKSARLPGRKLMNGAHDREPGFNQDRGFVKSCG